MDYNAHLGEIAELVMGQSPKGEDVNNVGKGIPLLNGPTEFTNRSPVPVQFTTEGKKFAEDGDILFCVRGSTTGRMNYADQRYVIGRGIAAIRGKNGYPTQYVRAVIERNLDRLLIAATGSTFPNLGRDLLLNFEVETVSPETAGEVNKLIVGLEDKIELNRQINQTLEEIAQAIFKSWFVDFEPVKAKIEAKVSGQDPERAAMCAISGKTDAELDQLPPDQLAQLRATAALFPDELNDSELGLIPKGWEVSTIGNEFHATMGQSPPGSTYNEVGEGMAFFQGRRDFGWRYPVNRVYCTEPKRIAKIGDTLLSVRAPVGDVNKATSGCCIGRGIAALRHKTGCEAYTYYSMKRLEHYFSSFDTEGTVFGSINQKDLKAIKLICPAGEVLKIFSKIAGKIDSQILNYEKQISTLTQLRDTLLPKLLSGEISVGSAQSTIDEVV